MTRYPAAERIAREITLLDGDDIRERLAFWALEYRRRHGAIPGEPEADAAKAVIEARLRNDVPPLPPSASSSGWGMCTFETGLPGSRVDTTERGA